MNGAKQSIEIIGNNEWRSDNTKFFSVNILLISNKKIYYCQKTSMLLSFKRILEHKNV